MKFFKGLFIALPISILMWLMIGGVCFGATYTIGPGQTYETFTALVAAETLAPDDIIDGGGNTFRETWTPDGSGTSGHPITIRDAIISGADIPSPWSSTVNFVMNGTIELNLNWSCNPAEGCATSERSSTQAHSGTYSWKFTANNYVGVSSDTFTTVEGQSYSVNLWVYPVDVTVVWVGIKNGAGTAWAYQTQPTITANAWNNITATYSEAIGAGGTGAFIIIGSPGGDNATFYFDDVKVSGPVVTKEDIGDIATGVGATRLANYIYYLKVTSSNAGTLGALVLYGSGGSGNGIGGLYTDSSGSPGSLVANSKTNVMTMGTGKVVFTPTGSVVIATNTPYWMAFNSAANYSSLNTGGSGGGIRSEAHAYDGNLPATATPSGSGVASNFHAYMIVNTSYNAWSTTTALVPRQIFFDDTFGTKVSSVTAVNGANEFFSQLAVPYSSAQGDLTIYSISDPVTAFTEPGVEASVRDYCVDFNDKNFITLDNLHLTKSNRRNVSIDGTTHQMSGAIIQNCLIDYSYSFGIWDGHMSCTTGPYCVKILNNEIAYCAVGDAADSYSVQGPIGIELNSSGADATHKTLVQGNNIHHNPWGFELDQGSSYIEVIGNHIHDQTVLGMNADNSNYATIAYNLIVNNGSNWGLRVWSATSETITGINLYNNTFYNNGTDLKVEDEQTNLKVKNNAIYTVFTAISLEDGHTYSGLDINNNLYYRASGTLCNYGGVSYSFADWKTQTGQDANSLSSNPLFTSTSDFHLQSSSPAINAGVDVGLTQDYEGNPIIGSPDMGVYEYQLFPALDATVTQSSPIAFYETTGRFGDYLGVGPKYMVQVTLTADSGDRTYPAFQINGTCSSPSASCTVPNALLGWYLFKVETYPGTVAPTNGWTATVKDSFGPGYDFCAGKIIGSSTANIVTDCYPSGQSYMFVNGPLNVAVSGNNVSSAVIHKNFYFLPK